MEYRKQIVQTIRDRGANHVLALKGHQAQYRPTSGRFRFVVVWQQWRTPFVGCPLRVLETLQIVRRWPFCAPCGLEPIQDGPVQVTPHQHAQCRDRQFSPFCRPDFLDDPFFHLRLRKSVQKQRFPTGQGAILPSHSAQPTSCGDLPSVSSACPARIPPSRCMVPTISSVESVQGSVRQQATTSLSGIEQLSAYLPKRSFRCDVH